MSIKYFNWGGQLKPFCLHSHQWKLVKPMKRTRAEYLLLLLLIYSGAGFGMGSRSATTSPTGSVHSTPTHQTKPNTLDPFADIGNLGGSFGGPSLEST